MSLNLLVAVRQLAISARDLGRALTPAIALTVPVGLVLLPWSFGVDLAPWLTLGGGAILATVAYAVTLQLAYPDLVTSIRHGLAPSGASR